MTVDEVRADLAAHRPELTAPFEEALPDARASVLRRLWTALRREPLPGVKDVAHVGGDVLVRFGDGRMAIGPALTPFEERPDLRVYLQEGGTTKGFEDPADLLRAAVPGHRHLEDELRDSVANLALARANHGGEPDLAQLQGDPRALADMEQSVVDGHPLHPCCRTRTGMSAEEVLRYAPEHRQAVDLEIWDVPKNMWFTSGAGLPPRLPVHPWQAEHLGELLKEHGLKRTRDQIRAMPLMSLRTLATLGGERHYKTSLHVQMTSAVRQVSTDAVHNGPRVTDLLKRCAVDLNLHIMEEVAAGQVAENPMLGVVVRKAPIPREGDIWTPLAALTRPAVARQAIALGYGGHPVPFWRDLVDVLVPPVLQLLARGIGLEAHGQNLLVRLAYGRPTQPGYRDVGGIRLHRARMARAGFDLPAVRGPLITEDLAELRAKPFATLLSTVLAELAELLEREFGSDPQTLWRFVAEHAEAAPDVSDRDALRAPTLPVKATTAMRLAADPVHDLWTPVPNPLGAR